MKGDILSNHMRFERLISIHRLHRKIKFCLLGFFSLVCISEAPPSLILLLISCSLQNSISVGEKIKEEVIPMAPILPNLVKFAKRCDGVQTQRNRRTLNATHSDSTTFDNPIIAALSLNQILIPHFFSHFVSCRCYLFLFMITTKLIRTIYLGIIWLCAAFFLLALAAVSLEPISFFKLDGSI